MGLAASPVARASPAADGAATDGATADAAAFAAAFDHTALKAETSPADVATLCEEAHRYSFASVCVNPSFVAEARSKLDQLANEDGCERTVKVCTVVGFPLGATTPRTKAFEAEEAVDAGAQELDMVLPVGRLRGRADLAAVLRDLSAVTEVGRRRGVVVKVILETALLDGEERDLAVWLCTQAGADFVKTSTGFAKGGATVEDVSAMAREAAKAGGTGVSAAGAPSVKASGGIRTCHDAVRMLAAGATRIGASASVAIFEECDELGVLTGAADHVRRGPRAKAAAAGAEGAY